MDKSKKPFGKSKRSFRRHFTQSNRGIKLTIET